MRSEKFATVAQFITIVIAYSIIVAPTANAVERIIVGIDDKVAFTTKGIEKIAPKQDYICFIDISKNPATPVVEHQIELENSVFGPPTNLAITPNEKLALVANAVTWVEKDGVWDAEPDNEIHIIDLTGKKPKIIDTLKGDLQPSGMAISSNGKLAAVANRKGQSVTLLRIKGKRVKILDDVKIGVEVSAVAFTPNGKRILASQFSNHKVAVIDIVDYQLVYQKEQDITVGLWPYNLQISPDGRYALTANNGNGGLPDGHIDTISVIDLQQEPPRTVDHIVVGDGPEGLAISPKGDLVAVPLLQGSAPTFENTFFHNKHGGLVILALNKLEFKEVARFNIGGFPEGVVFSEDGKWLYVGNLLDNNISVFSIDGQTVKDTGYKIPLPGQPASMRSRNP